MASHTDNAYLTAQAYGKHPSLCTEASDFETLITECQACLEENGSVDEFEDFFGYKIGAYLGFCKGEAPTTPIHSIVTSAIIVTALNGDLVTMNKISTIMSATAQIPTISSVSSATSSQSTIIETRSAGS